MNESLSTSSLFFVLHSLSHSLTATANRILSIKCSVTSWCHVYAYIWMRRDFLFPKTDRRSCLFRLVFPLKAEIEMLREISWRMMMRERERVETVFAGGSFFKSLLDCLLFTPVVRLVVCVPGYDNVSWWLCTQQRNVCLCMSLTQSINQSIKEGKGMREFLLKDFLLLLFLGWQLLREKD